MTEKQRLNRRAKMCDMYSGGMTMGEIGAKFGITRQRVDQILNADIGRQAVVRARMSRPSRVTMLTCAVCGNHFRKGGRKACCSIKCASIHRKRWTKERLIASLKRFYDTHGIPPGQAEMNSRRYGYLASHMTYVLEFGNVSDAQRAARIPVRGSGAPGHKKNLLTNSAA